MNPKVKIGDVVEIVELGNNNAEHQPHLYIGDKFKVIKIDRLGCAVVYNPRYTLGISGNFQLRHSKYKIVSRKEIKTEVDWLDAIKDNFKDGV